MELLLTGKKSINQLNRDFKKFFPYLRLELSRYIQKPGMASLCLEKYPRETKLEEIAKPFLPAVFEFDHFLTVAQLEKRFQKEFGLCVQVYLKKNLDWIDAYYMDSYSLEDINQMATVPAKYDVA